ncbi:hypothetical protein A3K86_18595 [Photobacterium jeanii]|uniref:Structural protein MipA n=2 Tax=Photobacterium jeanii TaxID=858640 RepID=A0A178K0Y3_9GAMM|nr:hypothetical protein A3K86_18595 [Photobacterium jeanii]PST90502.1 hypothetical protein C9I91_07695 [Photobacterium jeanii]
MNKNALFGCITFTALSTFSGITQAQERFKDFTFVGAGVAAEESVFSVDGAKPGAALYLFHHSQYGFVDGGLGNVAITPWFGISGNIRLSEVSSDFRDIPNGINDRDSNGELGVTFGTLGARLTFLHDVTDKHNGYEIQLHLGRILETPLDDVFITPYFEIDYRDKKFSDYLYSVSSSESSASGLAQFQAQETWVYKGGLIGLYDYSDNLLGISKLELEHHDSDSPLVTNNLGWKFSIGAAYKF